jgi:hypothetical protein
LYGSFLIKKSREGLSTNAPRRTSTYRRIARLMRPVLWINSRSVGFLDTRYIYSVVSVNNLNSVLHDLQDISLYPAQSNSLPGKRQIPHTVVF